MFPSCTITACKYSSRVYCFYCKQNLCRNHFNEHADLIKVQINPLVDKINELNNRFTAFNIERMKGDSHQKLQQWREEFDRELIVVKQKQWLPGDIMDLCWSLTLAKFIVTMKNDVYLVNENTMLNERIKTIPKKNWYSCTCSETSLFLSTNDLGSSIMEFSLLPSIELVNQWQSPVTCLNNERILDITYSNGAFALMILNQTDNLVHMEVKSRTKFERVWSIVLNISHKYHISSCCSLEWDEWLIIDGSYSY